MAATDGHAAARVALFDALAREPWSFDFFQALRRIECAFPDRPRLGTALRPSDEPVRVSQEASVAFAPSTLSGFEEQEAGLPPRLEQRFFGLLGPNGPLPLHITEYARERLLHNADRTFARFLDLLHHRLALMFYRAWAQVRPTVQHDRPDADGFALYVGSLAGYGSPGTRGRDTVSDHAKRFFVGHLARSAKNAEGLASMLEGYFGLRVRVEQFVLGWLELPRDQRTRLGDAPRHSAQLAVGTVLGSRVRDVQSKFRIVMGPMDLDRFYDFLPGAPSLARLVDWVRNYVGFEFDWEVQLVLARDEVPGIRLGQEGQLGWTTWLGARRSPTDADDLILTPERRQPAEPVAAMAA
ncbi:MAG: type VI secretion system baseplate subunit TssG [Candidatus Rokuibacteriota bacterium]|nr:MAG: type VI secretion system baseplate subunit TssG [Candidatus Rokubacteria bacterium]